jgi:hypothetical protein
MSRTYKDKPYKLKHRPWDTDTESFRYVAEGLDWYTKELRTYLGFGHLELPTTKTKKRKEVDTEDHWMTTPGWWNRMMVTRPERKRVNSMLKTVSDVEEVDIPDCGRKPHIYFW